MSVPVRIGEIAERGRSKSFVLVRSLSHAQRGESEVFVRVYDLESERNCSTG